MAITGGFGVEYDLISGRSRRWYIDSDGVRQYLIGDRPLTSICARMHLCSERHDVWPMLQGDAQRPA